MSMSVSSLLLLLLFPAAPQTEKVEGEVRKLEVEFNQAYERNQLDQYFSYYADDVTLWFPSGRETLEGYKKDWYALIGGGGGVEKNALSDLKVQIGPSGDSAIATYAVEVVTRGADGKRTKERAFETDVWFLREGNWKLVHVHYNSRQAP
jgi:ketosteroid isomerase-like protein